MIVGYGNSSVKCWNLKSCSVISTSKLSHTIEMPVSKIDLYKGDQYLACTTESVCLVSEKTGKVLSKFGHSNTGTTNYQIVSIFAIFIQHVIEERKF